jgi:membrane protein required for colicin V production
MNAFDGVIMVVLVAFTLIGALRGFVLEVLSLVLWPAAALIAWLLAEPVGALFEPLVGEPRLRLVAAFVLVFLVAFVLGTIGVYVINRVLPLRGVLRKPNALLGGAAGFARGAIVIVLVFLLAGVTQLPQRSWWQESLLAPYFERVALAAGAWLPRDIARHLSYG